jgi:tetratricopeptide (TPR) repeat protein
MRLGAPALILILLLPLPTFAQSLVPKVKEPTAKAHFNEGMQLYGNGKYDAAIRELRLAYALEQVPELLYVLGQAERKSGHCDEAIAHYLQYLATAAPTQAKAARFQIERCQQERHEAATNAQQQPTQPTPPTPASPPVVPPPRRPVYRDWAGMSLVSVGAASGLTGAGLWIGSTVELQNARAGTYDHFNSVLATAQNLRIAGITMTAVGGAMLIAGIVRLAWIARRARPSNYAGAR